MEGQEQHILPRVSEKSTLSSSQGNATAAPQPDFETGEERSPPGWDRMLISKVPGDLTDLDCDCLSSPAAALGSGGVYIQRGLQFQGFWFT